MREYAPTFILFGIVLFILGLHFAGYGLICYALGVLVGGLNNEP